MSDKQKGSPVILSEDDYLMHYGILRKSGRYPWGSGDDQSTRNRSFLDITDGLRKDGMSDPDIARGFDMTTTELRAARSIAGNEQKQALIGRAQQLKDKGYSNVAIGSKMGINESSVRSLLDPGLKDRTDVLQATASMLKKNVDEKGYIDIGTGVENQLEISDTKLKTAVAILQEQGYTVHKVQVDQLGTKNKTTIKVLAPPGTTYRDIVTNKDKIQQIKDFSNDGGRSYLGLMPPINVSSKRVGIVYADEKGGDADGVIYVRPGVKDLSLGGSRYAQVRIAVDGTHYLKGMAVYRDNLPDGVDLQFHTNKKDKGNKLQAMKEMKDDPDNPFGSVVRQQIIQLPDGSQKNMSAINLVNDEGSWDTWSKSLSTQVLSKQSPTLAKNQLDMTFERKKQDLDEILALTNPAVRKKLLKEFSDGADSSAVHLKAAALPRQKTHVLLPVNTLKENEIYAPNYRNGETVALIRYPHGGTFEIPELTVNNNHRPAIEALGRATAAVGINSKVASRLSGADFDGDTVLVIPNGNRLVKTTPALVGLKDFDPQAKYAAYDGMKTMGGGTWDEKSQKEVFPPGKTSSGRTKGIQMGLVSNLITDMTIQGASPQELARAVRHSMVVIDGEKHRLNYRQSAVDNGIGQLYKKYQGRSQGGASTLISRATSPTRVAERTPRSAAKGGPIDRATGRKVYEDTGVTYVNKDGKTVAKTTSTVKLAEARDANDLSSGTTIERVYASHSNRLKDLADNARREMVNTKTIPYSPSAKAVYFKEVRDLDAKLNLALRNRPLERQAQVLANTVVSQKRAASPDMSATDLKKIKSQALAEMRARTGAKKTQIDLTPGEWAAIQAGAITNNKLEQILENADTKRVKQLATPRTNVLMTSAKTSRAKRMAESGYTQAEIADALGVSVSTLQTSIVE